MAASGGGGKVLITIFQRGAVDGLNMVVPFGERDYYTARPTHRDCAPGTSPDSAIALDGFFGLHPRLAPLEPLYKAGHLAIVHACGSPDGTRSHFDAQDYMETATPGVKSTDDGWLNRYLHAREHQARRRSARSRSPRSCRGRCKGGAGAGDRPDQPVRAPRRRGGERHAGLVRGPSTPTRQPACSRTRAARRSTRCACSRRRIRRSTPPANGAEYPRSAFGHALRQIAQLVKADVGLEVAFAESGDWDHHVNQGAATGQLATRLDDFGRGIAALARDLGDRMRDVVILTMSEFGRAVAENGSRGTDHGHGNAMLVIGGGVKGGRVYGRWPGLAREQRYEGRDLAVTTDFRSVFAEIVRGHLGLPDTAPSSRASPDAERSGMF